VEGEKHKKLAKIKNTINKSIKRKPEQG